MNETLRRELKKLKVTGVRTTIVCPGHINTGLFEGFTQSFMASIFSPSQGEESVAKEIIQAIEQRSEELFLPRSFRSAFLFRFLFSSSTNDYLFQFMGGYNLMDGFKGRS